MATTIFTGRDCTLTIDSVAYNDQIQSATLELELDRQEFDVWTGTGYKVLKTTGTLSVEMLQDWGAPSSICEALFTAAKTDPDTPLAFSLVANTGATLTGNVFVNYPAAGGGAADALVTTVEFMVQDGDVTLA